MQALSSVMDALQDFFPLLFNFDLLGNYGGRLVSGVIITFEVIATSSVLGFLLAYPLCRARMSRNWFLSKTALAYVTFFRGTPLLCQLYLVYYGAGEIRMALTSIGLWYFFKEAYFCCIFAFSLNTAAYQSEIMRGAIAAVPKGQIEAAKALGLSSFAISRNIIFPQALLVAIRPMGNELITLIKASALAAIVTLLDLMGQTRFVFARTFDFSVYLYCAFIYLAMTETIRRVLARIERAASRHLLAESSPPPVMAGTARQNRGAKRIPPPISSLHSQ